VSRTVWPASVLSMTMALKVLTAAILRSRAAVGRIQGSPHAIVPLER
jgi:hypothetical protein